MRTVKLLMLAQLAETQIIVTSLLVVDVLVHATRVDSFCEPALAFRHSTPHGMQRCTMRLWCIEVSM